MHVSTLHWHKEKKTGELFIGCLLMWRWCQAISRVMPGKLLHGIEQTLPPTVALLRG